MARLTSEGTRRFIPPLLGLLLFGGALFILRRELDAFTYHALAADLLALPVLQVVVALVLTLANYGVLTGYDFLAFAYVRKQVPALRLAAASFVAYAVSNSAGFAMLSGAAVRLRFCSRWGIGVEDLSRIVVFNSVTFWLGILVLGGTSLALDPLPAVAALGGYALARLVGVTLLALVLAYFLLSAARRGLRVFGLELHPVGARYAALQIGLSTLDWALAVGVLYALLPSGKIGFWAFLGAFVSAQLVGLLSHVPGGLGIFESALVLLCKPALDAGALVPALVLFRFIYYLLPLGAALAVLLADETWARRHQLRRAGEVFGALSLEISPRLLAVLSFLAGVVLLFSGATPAASGRLALLARLVPLPLVEASHFLGSVAGVGLLVLSRGIARRLDASYYLVLVALGTGIVTSLLKGGDVEEALILAVLLAVFVPSREHFDRRAAFLSGALSPAWIAAVGAAVASAVWLGFFAFKHVEYSHDLWWQFELEAEAPRFLRASVGSALALLVLALGRLMRPGRPELPVPTEEDFGSAGDAIARQQQTQPFLVYLRDKALLFDELREAFVMYGVQGRTWIALGDPVGGDSSTSRLVRAFLEKVDDFGGTPVFYQVHPRRLHVYADFGLVLAKVGEQARVDLTGFSTEGSAAKPFRNILSRMQKEATVFRMVTSDGVSELLPELRRVSDEWLDTRSAAEKGFSLGFFDEEYLRRFPVAVLERGGRVEAFANVWPGPGKMELSVDLMRYRPDAPKNAMEALFVHMMLWGKSEGFHHFDLGMAPLSGLETSDVASLWNRIASTIYERGGGLYNFQGLRAYKEKFHPVWEPRYLAWPGGLSMARILADVSALIAGGYRRIFAQ